MAKKRKTAQESRGRAHKLTGGGRTTKVEHKRRIAEVTAELLDGKQPKDIVDRFHVQYEVSRRTVEKYLSIAYRNFQLHMPDGLEQKRALHTARLTKCYLDAEETNEKISALNALAKIHGLNAPTLSAQTDIEGKQLAASSAVDAMKKTLKDMSSEELRVMASMNNRMEEIVRAKGSG